MKILIFGTPGSGKTTIASKLNQKAPIPLYHIDSLFFHPGWIEKESCLFLDELKKIIQTEDWIIEGNAMQSLQLRYQNADIAIYLNFPRRICLFRAFKRHIRSLIHSKKNPSSKLTWKFLRYLWNYSKRYQMQIESLHKKYPKVIFYEVKNREQIKKLIHKLNKLHLLN
ncbi:MAG TPA: hypothetical protein P5048_02795 [Chlamydiales bacterium]|nr:hypothetical protein [Chlamydiales bacterium]